jgi:hypothetical protein
MMNDPAKIMIPGALLIAFAIMGCEQGGDTKPSAAQQGGQPAQAQRADQPPQPQPANQPANAQVAEGPVRRPKGLVEERLDNYRNPLDEPPSAKRFKRR